MRTSQEVTHPSTTLAQAHLTADVGMIAPVRYCTINVYMGSAARICFKNWETAGKRSDAVLWDLVANNKEEKQRKKEKNVKKRCNTRASQEVTHPSTTRAQARLTADAGMIAPVKCCTINVYMASAAGISFNTWEDAGERSDAVLWDLVANNKEEKQRKKEKNVKKWCNTRCISAGIIAPVKCCTINVYMVSAAGISFNTWEDAGERSGVDVRVSWSRVGGTLGLGWKLEGRKTTCNTRTSQEVTHPSTTLAQPCLTADVARSMYIWLRQGYKFQHLGRCGWAKLRGWFGSEKAIAVLWDLVGNKKDEKQRKKEKNVKKSCDGIRCINAGMIAPVKCCTINVYMNSAAGISCNNWEDAGERSDAVLWDLVENNKEEKQRKKGGTQGLPKRSPILSSDGIRCISAGMITPVKCCTINVYMASAAGISFNTWEESVLWDFVGNKKDEKQRKREKNVKKRCNTRTSQEATHPSTTLAQPCFTCGCWYDRTCQVLHDQCIYGFGSGYKFQPLGRRGRAKLRGSFGSEKAIAVLWDLVANNKEEKQRKKEKNVKKGATRGLPRSSDGIRCICAGMITRVKCCTINIYMNSAAGISCNTWEDVGERSDAVLWDLVANNKEEKQRKKETTVKKRCNTRTSQEVTHPSTCLAHARLIADAGMITPVKCCTINVYMASAAGISFNTWEDAGERSEMDGLGPKKP
ncbi:hypothetical protein V8G54_034826 [Vigna mungo]|uniref:Uncharacterized protein n=1 Tax=Vigna mungo TaxID=3915 RepID=A0AAQ3MDY0_VIGMU